MDSAQISAFAETARRFAQRDVAAMVGTEGRDGDLEGLAGIMDKAEAAGLLAAASPDSPGFEYGVWGRACIADGPQASLAVLQEVATECAGVAVCLHAAGLGALELRDTDIAPKAAAAAFFEPWRFTRDLFLRPPQGSSSLNEVNGRPELRGAKPFVHAPPGCEGFIIYAAGDSGWERAYVPRETQGIEVEDLGRTTGLAAVEVKSLRFGDISIAPEHRLARAGPGPFVRRSMLGLCAAAIGNACGALRAAGEYAQDRYQGCAQIEEHAAVGILLGDARSRIDACKAHLDSIAHNDDDTDQALWRSLAAKLRITLECGRAVTDCLQVLGGYGYMEDYRLEKRLRDAMTLKSMCLRPDDLRMLCFEPAGEEVS